MRRGGVQTERLTEPLGCGGLLFDLTRGGCRVRPDQLVAGTFESCVGELFAQRGARVASQLRIGDERFEQIEFDVEVGVACAFRHRRYPRTERARCRFVSDPVDGDLTVSDGEGDEVAGPVRSQEVLGQDDDPELRPGRVGQ